MNIFYLDDNPITAAKYHNDKHVVKMVTETAQILCSALRHNNIEKPWMYRLTHKNHPCVLWSKDWGNFNWLCELGFALSKEYTYRYGKIHKSESIIEKCYSILLENNHLVSDHTKPALAMPETYINDNPVIAYRNYYLGEKQYYEVANKKTGLTKKVRFVWDKNREEPNWWIKIKL